jgi:pilus assembly protein CpaE
MQTLIASDDPSAAERLRAALAEQGVNCPLSHIVSLDAARQAVAAGTVVAELTFVVISSDVERAIGTLEDIRRAVRSRVVVIGSARDPNVILRAVHAGPDDYLDIEGNFGEQLQGTLARVKSTAADDAATGRLISFVSHSGGSGCSFLAANTAVALAGMHDRCALCDFNLRRGDLATLFNLKPRFSINDLSRNASKLDQGMFEQALIPHDSGVHLLAAPPSLTDVHPITLDAAEQIVRLARSSFPYVLADLEDFFHAEQFHLLRSSHLIFFVLRLDFTALRNARRTLEYVERDGLDLARVRIVVNQYGRSREITVGQAENVLERKLTLFVPYDQRTAGASINRGVPVMWEAPKSKVGRAIHKIAEMIAQYDAVTA